MVEPLISLTDLAVIGALDDSALFLAAVGLVGSFLAAITWTLAQTKTSISSIVSRALGSGKELQLKPTVSQALYLNLLLGLFLMLLTISIAPWIFKLYGAEGELLSASVDYYRIRALGYPLTLVAFATFGVLRGLQDTLWAMKASIAGALVNVLLDLILVHGIPGIFPAYELEGAAWASVIAQAVLVSIALMALYRATPYTLRWYTPTARNSAGIKEHLQLAGNFFLRTVSINVAIFLANRYATALSTEHLAAQSILMNIWLFFSFFIDGFSNAGNAMSGKMLGSRDAAGLRELSITLTQKAVRVALILAIICALLYRPIGRLFTEDVLVQEYFYAIFWLVLAMQPINAVAFIYDGFFKGWGEARYLRNLLFGVTAFGFVPLLFLGQWLDWKLYAIWIAFTVWMIGRGGWLLWAFRGRVARIESSSGNS